MAQWEQELYSSVPPEVTAALQPPMVVLAEARRRAEEIYNQLLVIVEDAMTEIRANHGRQMARLVMAELVKLEANVPAASVDAD